MNHPAHETTAMAFGNEHMTGNPHSMESGTSIARIVERQALTPAKLEERRLIHRNDAVRQYADSFRELRTRLLALGGDRSFVTLVVPVGHGCGGSFVARNLAAAFAFDESKTAMLIDCDARHPSQHRALDLDAANVGLMDYLEDPGFDLDKVMYGTGIPRLHLIPTGRPRETTAESFVSPRMHTMIDSLRSHNDDRYLILDGPAVQGSPDARILSDLADFVVLVAGYGKVTMEQVDKAAASFAPEKLAGVVFNNGP
jgi:Mrp family chromosome partitioning ATPase